MRRSSHRPSDSGYYIEDCRIFDDFLFHSIEWGIWTSKICVNEIRVMANRACVSMSANDAWHFQNFRTSCFEPAELAAVSSLRNFISKMYKFWTVSKGEMALWRQNWMHFFRLKSYRSKVLKGGKFSFQRYSVQYI